MPSLPISGLPAGTPTDADLLVQSTGAAGQTQKITELQLFNYIASKALNNVVYVSTINGADSAGRGSCLTPYASISFALSQITTADVNNTYTIVILGGFITDGAGQIKLKPFVNVVGDSGGTVISNSNPIIIDTPSWQANSGGFIFLQNLFTFGDIDLDFSSVTSPGVPTIFVDSSEFTTNFSILGTANVQPNIIIYSSIFSSAFFDNCTVEKSDGNAYQDLKLGSNSLLSSNSIFSSSDIFSTFEGNSPNSGPLTGKYLITGALGVTGITINGTNSNIKIDSSSLYGITPTLTSGATVTLLDTATNVFASNTRSSYTPTSATVEGNFQGLDAELNIGTGRVAFGIFGGGIFGDSTFIFDISTKKLTVNEITALRANISTFGIGYHEINDGISLNLSNPMPTTINVTNAGSGLAIKLPDMTDTRALQANRQNIFYILNNGNQTVDVLYNSGTTLLSIIKGQHYKFTVTDNSTVNGSFIFEQTNPGINIVTGTQSSIIATTPSSIQFGFATDTLQLLFYNTSAWVIAA